MEQDVFPGCTPPSIFSASRIILRKTSTAILSNEPHSNASNPIVAVSTKHMALTRVRDQGH
ncbi:hypothetical protein EYF80_001216 [Liparis tanakae]|uniref:Uncharacterized protein n=1 Tax=Liparis tanakae TaxID=230148 RepID=A0A4Z2JF45_9TELE|nr:hypothetical protein EYF80_001216 [Liparis tanakae]